MVMMIVGVVGLLSRLLERRAVLCRLGVVLFVVAVSLLLLVDCNLKPLLSPRHRLYTVLIAVRVR